MRKRATLLVLVVTLFGCGDDSPVAPPSTAPSDAAPVAAHTTPTPAADGRQPRIEQNDENVDIRFAPQDAASLKDATAQVVGPVWKFTAAGKDHHAFRSPVTIELPYDPSRVPAGKRVGISVWENRRWRHVPDSIANALTRTVSAPVGHFSTLAPTAFEPAVRVIGRWYGSAVNTHVEPALEQTLSRTAYTTTGRYKWVFRVEAHDLLSHTRVVAESATWSVHIGEAWWFEPAPGGRRLIAVPEQRYGRSYGERELNGPMDAEDQRRLSEYEAEIAAMRPLVARLEAEYASAGASDRPRIESEYQSAKRRLHDAERSAASVHFDQRPVWASPYFQRSTDASTDREEWRVMCGHGGTAYDFVVYDAFHLDAKRISHTRGTIGRAMSMHRPIVAAPPAGPFRFTTGSDRFTEVHEYVGTMQPGNAGRQVTLTGRVVHRLRVPAGDDEANVILRQADWADDRVIAPVGTVRIGAWLAEPDATRPPDTPPDSSNTVSQDGSFSVPMYLLPDKLLFLAATWANAEAQLTERQWVAIQTNALIHSSVAAGAEVPLTEGIQRGGFATVRYAMATKELDLGGGADGGAPGGTLRRNADGLELAFDKSNAILLGSFVLRAPHINQNLESVPVKVDVPPAIQERIVALCLTHDQEKEVLARFHRDAPGDVTTINFPGYVVCAPTSCVMALRGLGLSADHRRIPQLIYDYEKAHDGDPGAPPWRFPFAYDFEPRIAIMTGNYGRLMTWHMRNPYTLWPLRNATAHTQKEWLATVQQSDHRPWQYAKKLADGLEAAFPNELAVEQITSGPYIDVFSDKTSPKVLNRLGAGRLAMISIDHTSRERRGGTYRAKIGGHYMALVGAVINSEGTVVRLICNDPYGDLTRHPEDEGYYDRRWVTGGPNENTDVDNTGHAGAYAPYYGPDIKTWDGRMYSKYWLVLKRKDQPQTAAVVRGRLLPAD